ncbi:AMMECR1-like protein [Smittium culicis]|uniref:AMMECR1-like protein n=1 Tax=Smittium culicis TaxID=133412 RepID=A0A1R1YT64_9FUNG|nr:AMMECR1-like protein [Smittium culicis]
MATKAHCKYCFDVLIATLEKRSLSTIQPEFDNSISAFRDSRFRPIKVDELPNLINCVSVLTNFELAKNYLDWEVGKHGIIINFVDNGIKRNGTFLPEVADEQEWDHIETIDNLIYKAGYEREISKSLRESLQVTRYQSSKESMSYSEYAKLLKN